MTEHKIEVNKSKCIGCSLCVKDCPMNNIRIMDAKAIIVSNDCIKCGHCVAICPQCAVSMENFDQQPIVINRKANIDSDELLYALQTRRTSRQFINKPVEQEKLDKIIEAGRWTPTAKNAKSVSFLVLQNDKDKAEAVAVSFFKKIMPIAQVVYPAAKGRTIDSSFFFKGAPLVIAVLSKDKISGPLAASNMALMAESQGLGVLYSGFFSMAVNMSLALQKILGLKHQDKVVTTLVIGYSSIAYRRTTQKDKATVYYR